jgi:hypothetical protein
VLIFGTNAFLNRRATVQLADGRARPT